MASRLAGAPDLPTPNGTKTPVVAAPAPVVAPSGSSRLAGAPDLSATPTPAQTVAASGQGDGTWTGLLHDMVNPQPADLSRPQTWRDWGTKTYSPTFTDLGNSALDDFSFGTADDIQAWKTGEDVKAIRERTAQSQAAMGPMGPVVNALTYAAPGLGESKLALAIPGRALGKVAEKYVAPKVGRYGAAMAEGAAANAASSAGHGGDLFDIAKAAGWGSVGGLGGQVGGDATSRVARYVANKAGGLPGRGSPGDFMFTDWRKNQGPATAADIRDLQQGYASGSGAHEYLGNAANAADRSIEPGMGAQVIKRGIDTAGAAAGVSEVGIPGVATIAPTIFAGEKIVNPLARQVNKLDRSMETNRWLDQASPYVQGGGPLSANVQPWIDQFRGSVIGAGRPVTRRGAAP